MLSRGKHTWKTWILFTMIVDWWKCLWQLWPPCFLVVKPLLGLLQAGSCSPLTVFLFISCCPGTNQLLYTGRLRCSDTMALPKVGPSVQETASWSSGPTGWKHFNSWDKTVKCFINLIFFILTALHRITGVLIMIWNGIDELIKVFLSNLCVCVCLTARVSPFHIFQWFASDVLSKH